MANQVIDTIMSRFSARGYTDQKLSDEQIDILAKAALASPSARNDQPWKIVFIKDEKLLNEYEDVCYSYFSKDAALKARIDGGGGKVLYGPPLLVIIGCDMNSNTLAHHDTGIVAQNIALAAKSLGLDTVIVGMATAPFLSDKGAEFKKRLGFPEGYEFGMGVCVGYSTEAGRKEPHELDWSKLEII